VGTPTVSVLLPVRNCERYLRQSIESVLGQSFEDFELVLVDDGSTDRSEEIYRVFEDNRIRVVPNGGEHSITHALNLGISSARGKYIARIDCDDVMMPQRLEKQVSFLESQPKVGLVGSWMRTFGERSTEWKYPVANPDIQLFLLFGSPFGHPSVMFRTKWLEGKKGYYDPLFDLAEDFELWTRMSQIWELANIPEYLTHYRTHPSQITKFYQVERDTCVRQIVEKHQSQIGVSVLPSNPTIKDFLAWWRDMETSVAGTRYFEGADFRRQQSLQLKLLVRKRLKQYLSDQGALAPMLSVRNLVERKLESVKKEKS
jgi:glycosyltransferase involved in cell wall biosynthesis